MDASAVFSGWFHMLKVQHGVEWRIEGVPSALTCYTNYPIQLLSNQFSCRADKLRVTRHSLEAGKYSNLSRLVT
jgi:hypothetical protein